jgi:DNA-binding response OmpR family regulator
MMKKRVLVIDDDPAILAMIEEVLSYEQYDVKASSTSLGALKDIREFKPDIVLVDYLIDHINGGDICTSIKSDPALKNIPVIIISAHPKVFHSVGTYNSDAFISKPFDLSELIGTIEACIRKNSPLSF